MDSLIHSVDSQAVLVIAAIAVALLFGMLLIRIIKARLILTIAAIFLVLQYGFGITPTQLWGEVGHLPQDIVKWVNTIDLSPFISSFEN